MFLYRNGVLARGLSLSKTTGEYTVTLYLYKISI